MARSNSRTTFLETGWKPAVLEAAPPKSALTWMAVMKEMDIDISKNRVKHLNEFTGKQFDYAVTLCGEEMRRASAPSSLMQKNICTTA